tara:strand:- start:64 stop:321 length:258 start_codon:yes stop_codon:yes gene_type:complete
MPEIKFNITDTEEKCLNTVIVGIESWANNAVTNRARIAQEEICVNLMKHCNDNNIAIATGIDAQITQAYAIGVAHTATSDVNPSE